MMPMDRQLDHQYNLAHISTSHRIHTDPKGIHLKHLHHVSLQVQPIPCDETDSSSLEPIMLVEKHNGLIPTLQETQYRDDQRQPNRLHIEWHIGRSQTE